MTHRLSSGNYSHWFLSLSISLVLFNAYGQGRLGDQKMTVDGRERRYSIYIPAGLENKKYPVVIVLHGGGGDARRMASVTGFTALAEREKFLVVYPNGRISDGVSYVGPDKAQ